MAPRFLHSSLPLYPGMKGALPCEACVCVGGGAEHNEMGTNKH